MTSVQSGTQQERSLAWVIFPCFVAFAISAWGSKKPYLAGNCRHERFQPPKKELLR